MLKDIDDTMRNFLWGGSEVRKNAAKVAWVDVCMLKKGGLGIPNILDSNKANMARHLRNLASKKDYL